MGEDEFIASSETLVSIIRDLVADRCAHPGDDLISDLIRVREGRDRLSEDELTSMVVLLGIAGHGRVAPTPCGAEAPSGPRMHVPAHAAQASR